LSTVGEGSGTGGTVGSLQVEIKGTFSTSTGTSGSGESTSRTVGRASGTSVSLDTET